MFSILKNAFSSLISQYGKNISSFFSRPIDTTLLEELKVLLLKSDVGIKTTNAIIDHLHHAYKKGTLQTGDDARICLGTYLLELLKHKSTRCTESPLILLVGINGSGKTTFAGKLAYAHQKRGDKVLLAAADTFRAAAAEQLTQWALKSGADIVKGTHAQDPASVVFKASTQFIDNEYDTLIIDTAGRLQTKTNLMKELEKIKRVLNRNIPNQRITTLLTIDASIGQNSLIQARLFHESTPLDGLVLTKIDGTSKGGIIFAIAHELNIPVYYLSHGEQIDEYEIFDSKLFVDELLNI